jgi:hypothetical protein
MSGNFVVICVSWELSCSTNCVALVPRLRMSGAVPPVYHASSWRCAIWAQEKFSLEFNFALLEERNQQRWSGHVPEIMYRKCERLAVCTYIVFFFGGGGRLLGIFHLKCRRDERKPIVLRERFCKSESRTWRRLAQVLVQCRSFLKLCWTFFLPGTS